MVTSTFGCKTKTTAGYSPFSNNVVKRHKEILKGNLTKIGNETFWESTFEASIAYQTTQSFTFGHEGSIAFSTDIWLNPKVN